MKIEYIDEVIQIHKKLDFEFEAKKELFKTKTKLKQDLATLEAQLVQYSDKIEESEIEISEYIKQLEELNVNVDAYKEKE